MPSDEPEPPSRAPIDRIRQAVVTPLAVRAALQLGLFTPLAQGPMTAEELADALGVKPRRLAMLLHQLVVAEFLELREGRFANTPMSAHYLVEGRPGYVGGIHDLWTRQFMAQLQTAESIRADSPCAKMDFERMSREELGAFLRGLHGITVKTGAALAMKPDFAEARSVVDVGGGSGGMAIALCQAHPHLVATVIDLPNVVPVAREMVEEVGLADRITVTAADAVAGPLPGRFDIATTRSLFQVLSEDGCRSAARNIAASLPTGGKLFLVGHVTDPSRLSPVESVGFNITFLNVYDEGEAYSESQYFDWLEAAGFMELTREPMLLGTSLISARKP